MLRSLLQKQLAHVPKTQPFYGFGEREWSPVLPSPHPPSDSKLLNSLRLITWNIDFMAPYPQARMESAMSYLETLVSSIPSSSPVVIFLQEMCESRGFYPNSDTDADDLPQLCAAPWVRERFYMTDIDISNWDAHYGTVTLVDRRLSITQVSRLPFVSEYGRDALLVDVQVPGPDTKLLRLCNVHLDSMDGPMRPIQWKSVAQHLQDEESGVVASILAGDCNATRPRDKTEPQDNGFKDAYLETGGVEDDETGATWGYQSRNWERYGRTRLDKMAFWGALDLKNFEKIGMGVKVEDARVLQKLEEESCLTFVTDHYGLMGEFKVMQDPDKTGGDDVE
ncbi:hypothetical protein P154DRAFT_443661 [Amniculicola lignicola CBS 123094]|uniref:Endonuclease/exonuclease/phosphatase domain-containing protein n=1 Tax=Amniculicola lignicola CBS 123094 TaxID=1392246 RepID=A0A6A5W5E7_9PLEO|nr:hypothetical protein P154DRAFT_443661 [Amniculicola lignicola CBS 123094]